MKLQWGRKGRARSLNETYKSRLLSEILVGKIGPALFPSHNEVQLSWQRSHAKVLVAGCAVAQLTSP